MDYKIKRGDQEFGPYGLVDLKRYVAEGRIAASDLTKSEGMEEWVPVWQVTGDKEIPPPAVATAPVPGRSAGAPATNLVPPPDLHWALLLLLSLVTCGLFGLAWMFIQASWVKKVEPKNNSIVLYGLYLGVYFVAMFLITMGSFTSAEEAWMAASFLVAVVSFVFIVTGHFRIRRSLHEYYQGPPIHLRLGPFMTFFFNTLYFQYHFTRINEWHKTGVLVLGCKSKRNYDHLDEPIYFSGVAELRTSFDQRLSVRESTENKDEDRIPEGHVL